MKIRTHVVKTNIQHSYWSDEISVVFTRSAKDFPMGYMEKKHWPTVSSLGRIFYVLYRIRQDQNE